MLRKGLQDRHIFGGHTGLFAAQGCCYRDRTCRDTISNPSTMCGAMIQSDLDLFGSQPQRLASHTLLLPGFALAETEALLDALRPVLRAAPFRHMYTPGGLRMAVGLTNCGTLGWVSDEHGYRYSPSDPLSGKPWPAQIGRASCRERV